MKKWGELTDMLLTDCCHVDGIRLLHSLGADNELSSYKSLPGITLTGCYRMYRFGISDPTGCRVIDPLSYYFYDGLAFEPSAALVRTANVLNSFWTVLHRMLT